MNIKRNVKVRIKSHNELGSKDTLLEEIGITPQMLPYIGKIVVGVETDDKYFNKVYLNLPELSRGSHSFLAGEYEVLEYLE